jgi:trigger factor
MLPDISDELAQTVGNFTTLAELREDLRRRLVEFKRSQAEQAFLTQALDAFTALAEVRYPQAFVEDQLNKLLEEFAEDVEDSQGLPFDEWLKVRNKTKEAIREELRPLAELRGRRGLVMRALAQAEGLTVSEEEFNARIDDIVKDLRRNSSVKAALRAPDIRSTIMSNILSDKILQRMAQIAKGELEATSPEPIAG